MDVCIVENNIITNVVVIPNGADPAAFGCKPLPHGKWIGDEYDSAVSQEKRIADLEADNTAIKEQLQQADDTAIELYEANMAQEEINAEQDDALLEIYELIGG